MHFTRTISCTLALLLVTVSGFAQPDRDFSSTGIYKQLQKLSVLGSAMYVAAHPDDENTRLIAHLSNTHMVDVTYLSMTRGDGGQNLIGPELRELLGVIRTQELMQARNIDGGNQMFTRANDFGYSKSPEETLAFWGKDEILSDVVFAIRKFQPDIIINRFPHEHLQGNHGHHTTSAMLSVEAFDLTGDPSAYPEQLKYVDTWQPRRVYMNTSWWFYGSKERFAEEADLDNMVAVNVAAYDKLSGFSDTELAARSRSMHKSQGFGIASSRGEYIEYLDPVRGTWKNPDGEHSLFEGIDVTWNRVEGGAVIAVKLARILADFDFTHPAGSLPALLALKTDIQAIPDNKWKAKKLEDLDRIILHTLGIYLEASTATQRVAPGDSLSFDLELTNRSEIPVAVTGIHLPFAGETEGLTLAPGESRITSYRVHVPESTPTSAPYWLREPGTEGRYAVPDQQQRGLPETPEPAEVDLEFSINTVPVTCTVPLQYKASDPVEGEVSRPFEILPRVFVNLGEPVYVFPGADARAVQVKVESNSEEFDGTLQLHAGQGWRISPKQVDVHLQSRGQTKQFTFMVQGPKEANVSELRAVVTGTNGETYDRAHVAIEYDHIDYQSVLLPSAARIVRLELNKTGSRVAYLEGAGDAIPEGLLLMGYTVDKLDPENLTASALERYDAVVLGVRAFNTVDQLASGAPELMKYVQNGGNLICQYNTSHRLVTEQIGPYPLELSRGRVTDETAEITLLNPDHAALNKPNAITQKDFEGWVQERGLYFASTWDPAYTPLIRSHDPGEEPLDGALLVAQFGSGFYVYTSLSLFRQIPAGVPGAYRLLANLISLNKDDKS